MKKLHLNRETLSRLTPESLQSVIGGAVGNRLAGQSGTCATMNAQCPTSGWPTCPIETHQASITGTSGVTGGIGG